MTPFYAFAIGFLTALLMSTAGVYGLYLYSRRNRTTSSNIKGYLDLIPDLSNNQREKVQSIRCMFLPKVYGIRENLRKERADLAELLFREPLDRPAIHDKTKHIAYHQSELEQEVIEHILEEKELLTPLQKKKFHDIILGQFASGGLGVHDVGGKP